MFVRQGVLSVDGLRRQLDDETYQLGNIVVIGAHNLEAAGGNRHFGSSHLSAAPGDPLLAAPVGEENHSTRYAQVNVCKALEKLLQGRICEESIGLGWPFCKKVETLLQLGVVQAGRLHDCRIVLRDAARELGRELSQVIRLLVCQAERSSSRSILT